MPQVSVGPEFFRSELRVYADWLLAFARELLQNSIDAKPTSIHIETSTDEHGHVRVRFVDDGVGMSRKVLEEVFFRLGETTKKGEDTIGGYGRARMVTCFAQRSYQIRTRNLRVDGCGGDYHIVEVDDPAQHVSGTEFDIVLLDDVDADDVDRAFRRLLRTCSIDVPIYLDGERVYQEPLPNRARRILRGSDDRAWGRVYTDRRSGGLPRLLVRVDGLMMFSQYLDGLDDDVIVELIPARARQVLSASRDRLADPFAGQFEQFRTDLIRNARSAFKPEAAPLRVHVSSGGLLTVGADPDRASAGAPVSELPSRPHDPRAADEPVMREPPRAAAAYAESLFGGADDDRGGAKVAPLGFDVYLLADSADSRVRSLARNWNPSSWDARVGRRRRAVLFAWKAAVEQALDTLVTLHPDVGQVSFTLGWTFDEDARAVHHRIGGAHVLALNPVDDDGRIAFKLDDAADLRRMLASALHEAVHVAVDGHDERFASVVTQMFGAVDQAATVRTMRDAARRA